MHNPHPSLINEDLAPTPQEARTWTVTNMASLWIGMVVCVPTYMLAGGLVDLGMSWWQAVLTVGLGNVIVLVPMILTGHAGTAHGVPFPVLARASFGVLGANIPALLRGLVACGWFGIQTWIGGAAIHQLLGTLAGRPLGGDDLPVLGINAAELMCFLAFWAIQVVILWRGIDSIKVLETWAAPFLIAMGLALLAWAWVRADGFGPMLAAPSQFAPGGPKAGGFWQAFFPALTGMVGFWATLSLNIPDFTRYAKSQRDQLLGQAIGLPTFMTLFAFIGVAVTSATVTIFGEPIPDPTALLGRMSGGAAVIASLIALTVATLSTNLAANVVSPANAPGEPCAAPNHVSGRRPGDRWLGHRHLPVATDRIDFGIHLHVAGRLFRAARSDRRHHPGRLFPDPPNPTRCGRPLPSPWHVLVPRRHQPDRARGAGDRCGAQCARLLPSGWFHHRRAAVVYQPLYLCLVRRVRPVRRRVRPRDARAGTAVAGSSLRSAEAPAPATPTRQRESTARW